MRTFFYFRSLSLDITWLEIAAIHCLMAWSQCTRPFHRKLQRQIDNQPISILYYSPRSIDHNHVLILVLFFSLSLFCYFFMNSIMSNGVNLKFLFFFGFSAIPFVHNYSVLSTASCKTVDRLIFMSIIMLQFVFIERSVSLAFGWINRQIVKYGCWKGAGRELIESFNFSKLLRINHVKNRHMLTHTRIQTHFVML